MGFWKNIKEIMTNITFKGRSTRKEIINYIIFNFLYGLILGIFCSFPIIFAVKKSVAQTGSINFSNIPNGLLIYIVIVFFIAIIIGLWMFIAGLALYVRRFHDLNYSGWAYFIYYIISVIICFGPPKYQTICTTISYIMGLALMIYLMSVKGTFGPNKYGNSKIAEENIQQPMQAEE